MKRVAIIPARGGSKRLKRKNIVDFAGQPIMQWTVDAAMKTGLFDRVIVSTEDEEIAEIARAAHAVVRSRSPDLATDTVGVTQVCLDVLDQEASAGRVYQQMVCLYATSPLRNADDIANTVALLDDGKTKFAMAVCEFDVHPVQALVEDGDGGLVGMWPDLLHDRAANERQYFCDNGSTYVVDVDAFRETKHFYGPGLSGYVMPQLRSSDINTQEDLDLTLAKLQMTK